ncbi:uncharacterized protein SOCE26_027160 [Sorangium cellulosum]|uniref:Uncharacterized protein n=1 Tax=Sorangium cellulosum TaxID=56 RepID=A0A2L0EPU1_SORCE|nr:uncharacterized protein SOCE26_027160 [Sorangium cellulosum]
MGRPIRAPGAVPLRDPHVKRQLNLDVTPDSGLYSLRKVELVR